MAARSSLLVRDATLLTDRQIQKIADEPKGVRTHAGQLAKLRVRFELAKGNLAAAIKELGSAPAGQPHLKREAVFEIANAAADPEVVAFANWTSAARVG
jgi:hypothetical protein